jgi:formylglycine-generating enzyme required for sulfatase activity
MRVVMLVLLMCMAAAGNAQAAAKTFRDCPDCPEMVVIPAGSFIMGSAPGEPARYDFEGPQQHVTITHSFGIATKDVTRADYARFVGETKHPAMKCAGAKPDARWQDPGFPQTDNDPVVCVGWEDAQAYIKWLNSKLPPMMRSYRLPTEAEWEYAARGGTTTMYYWGVTGAGAKANCNGCDSQWGGRGTSPAGAFPANPFGLFDMTGNVWQWVQDCWNMTLEGVPLDGSAWMTGDCSRHVARGGSWFNKPENVRIGFRTGHTLDAVAGSGGFRVAKSLAQ